MFDEATSQALSKLGEEDLFKVSKMIQKLAKKRPAPKESEDDNREDSSGFLHEIGRETGPNKSEPLSTEGNRPNLFDEMSEKNGHQADIEIDKKLSVRPPSERSRISDLVEVTCRSCDKIEEASASLIPQEAERYICNRCQVRGMKK
jgi:hypothetical protein